MTRDETIFAEALQIVSAGERAAFVERACPGDADMRRQIRSLLHAHEHAEGFLEPLVEFLPPGETIELHDHVGLRASASGAKAAAMEGIGTCVGPYKLLERLGDGGMGVVYMAEQLRPIRRRVALKIIKPGMDSRQVIARFEAERQALALMDHPGIARVLDVGTTDAGRPYFAMELVRGVPITEYCDANHLMTRERLALFMQVCHAVQHAHTKGVIHRDLKPTNVMVTLHDGVPVPKVIDFGIAKAVNQRLTERTLFTNFAQLIGTPLYMSPEQAELNGLDVDTRSDIYSLGVILYELLTGTTPFDKQRLGSAAWDEMRRIIREEDPPRPSTRLGTLAGGALGDVSSHRKTDPKKLGQLVRGELDWIVMRCLDKDRTRRYVTANALACDVQRYLADEPVEACPPGARYKIGKLLRRHRGPVLAASLLFFALIGGVLGTSWGLARAKQGHAEAELARKDEAEQRRLAEENALSARQRLTQIEKVNTILYTIFRDVDPNPTIKNERSLRVVLGERLDRLTSELQDEAVGDAITVAKLQNVLGSSQRHLGYPNKAIPLLKSARQTVLELLGPDDPLTIEITNNLGVAYLHAAQVRDAIPLLEESVRRQADSDHEDTLVFLANLGDAYATVGRLKEAVPLLEETLKKQIRKFGEDGLPPLTLKMNLAKAYQSAGRPQDALRLGEEVLRTLTKKFGPDHRLTLVSMGRLADTYWAQENHQEALRLYKESWTGLKAVLGPETPETCLAATNLAWAYHQSGDSRKALPLFVSALKGQEKELGQNHQETLRTMGKLGLAYQGVGEMDTAVRYLQQALELGKAVRGPHDRETLVGMNNLACAYFHADRIAEAIPLLKETLATDENVLGPTDEDTVRCLENLINAYNANDQPDEALPLIQRLVQAYEARGDSAEAEKWRKELPARLMAESSSRP